MLTLIVSTRSAPLCHGANLASEPFRRLGSDLGEKRLSLPEGRSAQFQLESRNQTEKIWTDGV